MIEVLRSAVIDRPIEQVWAAIRDFNGLAAWEPAVASSHIEDGLSSDAVGCVRNFVLQDGTRIRERLLDLNDRDHSFSYAIIESDLPLRDYEARSQLLPVTQSGHTLFVRRARFFAPEGREQELERLVAVDVMEASFAGLRSLLKQGVPAPAPARSSPVAIELPSRMIRAATTGGPEVLEVVDGKALPPAADEVRVRQTAIGVNFIDVYCRRGDFDLLGPDRVLGFEAAGVAEAVGAEVRHLAVGDRIAYVSAEAGAYASVRTIPAERALRIPSSISDEQAAAALLKGTTASYLLNEVAPPSDGAQIVVLAAAGGTGNLLCQWAASLGARVIGIVSRRDKEDFARSCGAREVVISTDGDPATAVREITNGRGAEIVFDAIGGATFAQSLAMLAPRGQLVSYGQAAGAVGMRDIDALTAKSIRLSRPNYFDYLGDASSFRRHAESLFAMLEQGKVKISIDERFGFTDARQAHERIESRSTCGSLVITV